MRLDHLLSKEEEVRVLHSIQFLMFRTLKTHISGGDALRGHTRSHPEHDG